MEFHIWASRLWILDPIGRQLDDFIWCYFKSVSFARYLDGIKHLDSFAKGKSGNKIDLFLEFKIGQMKKLFSTSHFDRKPKNYIDLALRMSIKKRDELGP